MHRLGWFGMVGDGLGSWGWFGLVWAIESWQGAGGVWFGMVWDWCGWFGLV